MNASLHNVPAPAKINLFLHIVGRRPDGYHLLQTVFRFIDLCDFLNFDRRSDGKIVRSTINSPNTQQTHTVPEETDLVLKAANLLKQATGTKYGVQLSYQKNIPIGGGLGGGSSNAASTLIALNKLWETGLNRTELLALAQRLGADVPVFIFGDSAFAQGTGEQLQAVKLPCAYYVLVQPNAVVDTGIVFQHPSLTRNEKKVTITDFTEWQRSKQLKQSNVCPSFFGRNTLEPIVFKTKPQVFNTMQLLKQLGFSARVTGSGACIFVECSTAQEAKLIQQEISCKIHSRESVASRVVRKTWVCSGLNEHPLKHWIHS